MQLSVREVNDPLAGRVFLVKGLKLKSVGVGIACDICSLREHRSEENWCSSFVHRAAFTCNSGRNSFEVPIAGDNAQQALEAVTAFQVAARLG